MWFYLLSAIVGFVIFLVLRNVLGSGGKDKQIGNKDRELQIEREKQELQKKREEEARREREKKESEEAAKRAAQSVTEPKELPSIKEQKPTDPDVFKKPFPVAKVPVDEPKQSSTDVKEKEPENEPNPSAAVPPRTDSGDQPRSGGRARMNLKKLNEEMQKKRANEPKPLRTTSEPDSQIRADRPYGSYVQPSAKKPSSEREYGSHIEVAPSGDRKKSAPAVTVPKWLQEDSSKKKKPELKKATSDSTGLKLPESSNFEAKRKMVEMLQLGVKNPPALVMNEEDVGVDERLLRDSEVEAEIAENEAAKLEEELRRLEAEIEDEENEGDDGPEDDSDDMETEETNVPEPMKV